MVLVILMQDTNYYSEKGAQCLRYLLQPPTIHVVKCPHLATVYVDDGDHALSTIIYRHHYLAA